MPLSRRAVEMYLSLASASSGENMKYITGLLPPCFVVVALHIPDICGSSAAPDAKNSRTLTSITPPDEAPGIGFLGVLLRFAAFTEIGLADAKSFLVY